MISSEATLEKLLLHGVHVEVEEKMPQRLGDAETVSHDLSLAKQTLAFVPPKPKLLDRATLTARS